MNFVTGLGGKDSKKGKIVMLNHKIMQWDSSKIFFLLKGSMSVLPLSFLQKAGYSAAVFEVIFHNSMLPGFLCFQTLLTVMCFHFSAY